MILKFDEPFFKTVLEEGLKDKSIEISQVENKCANERDVNFLSDIFKATVRYSSKKHGKRELTIADIVIKTEPLSVREEISEQERKFFLNEVKVLRDLLPRIQRQVNRQIGPKLYYCSLNPTVFAMEDLTVKGYAMKNRQVGLSVDHSLLLLEQMAHFHAGSVAEHEKDPGISKSFRCGIVSSLCDEYFLRMMEVCLQKMSRAVRDWPEKWSPRIADKLLNLSRTIRIRTKEAYDFEPDDFCVLNHGDCWTNNIMFKEDQYGKPCSAIMIDYQMAVYSSPAIDLIYFLYICPMTSVKCEKHDLLLEHYAKTLSSVMQSIECKTKPPTMQALKDAMYKRRAYAVFAGLILYPRMVADKEQTEDFVTLAKLGGETRMNVFDNPNTVEAVRKLLVFMDENGYLD